MKKLLSVLIISFMVALIFPAEAPAPIAQCGDGIVNQAWEECDPPDDSACHGECVECLCPEPPICGDGVVNQDWEECDPPDDSACKGECVECLCPEPPKCGDGVINQDWEICDGDDDEACPGKCKDDCTCPECGDGILDPDEECDPYADPTGCYGYDVCTMDCICKPMGDPGQVSIQINDVMIEYADKYDGTASGSFIVKNQSGGDSTFATLGEAWMDFRAIGQGGDEGYYGATCIITPEASGYVLAPHEEKLFAYSCTDFVWTSGKMNDLSMARELTAFVYIDGACNQIGECRNDLWSASSPFFKFSYSDFDNDSDVDGSDAVVFKGDFGRSSLKNPCSPDDPCPGDFKCDGDVDGEDANIFKTEFGTSSLR